MLLCFSGLMMAHAVLNDIEQLIDELDRDADEEVTLNAPFYLSRIDKALLNCSRLRRTGHDDVWDSVMVCLYSLRCQVNQQRIDQVQYNPPRVYGEHSSYIIWGRCAQWTITNPNSLGPELVQIINESFRLVKYFHLMHTENVI